MRRSLVLQLVAIPDNLEPFRIDIVETSGESIDQRGVLDSGVESITVDLLTCVFDHAVCLGVS